MIELALEIDTSGLEKLIDKIEGKVAEAVAETCFAVEREAKRRAPVDTGALKNSIVTILFGDKGAESGAWAAALALNPTAQMLPLPYPESPAEGIVGVPVHYGPDVEYGTTHKTATSAYSIPAQPYLEPSMAQQEDLFETRVASRLEELLP